MIKIKKKKFKLPISEMVGVPSEIELNIMEDDKENEGGLMIKIDYEGAWKEFRDKYGEYLIDCQYDSDDIWVDKAMDKLEQKHTKEVT